MQVLDKQPAVFLTKVLIKFFAVIGKKNDNRVVIELFFFCTTIFAIRLILGPRHNLGASF